MACSRSGQQGYDPAGNWQFLVHAGSRLDWARHALLVGLGVALMLPGCAAPGATPADDGRTLDCAANPSDSPPPPATSAAQGFCIGIPADPAHGYAFKALVTADNYTWDLGDNLGLVYGHDVQHVYDVRNATLNVILYARTGSETRRFENKAAVVRGSGINSPATFFLEAEKIWVVTGERVRFSSAASRDPDGDVLRFAWACARDAPPYIVPHAYPPAPPPTSPSPGHVYSAVSNYTLPEPTIRFDSSVDMCTALGPLGTHGLSTSATTIEGNFLSPGRYSVFLVAADPAHPPVSGEFTFVVTPPGERPPPVVRFHWSGTFAAGAQGETGNGLAVQPMCSQPQLNRTCDSFDAAFSLPAAKSTLVNLTYSPGPASGTQAQNQVAWTMTREDGFVVAKGGPGQGATKVPSGVTRTPTSFVIHISDLQGASVDFAVDVTSFSDLNVVPPY